ncbi:21258_t:CDS:2 [Rhizophagus irregularis]|nr:21258_t:CDS:2 [Rhizophagus irregularis]
MSNLEKATGVEHIFKKHFDNINTRVGYIGGATANPRYREVCSGNSGHAEACQIEFDPTKTSYETLVEFFYKTHDPTTANRQGPDVGTQYRSAIFYHSSEQKEIAEKVTEQIQEKLNNEKNLYSGNKIVTEIVEAADWYDAEDYHQKYLEKNPSGYEEQQDFYCCTWSIDPISDTSAGSVTKTLQGHGGEIHEMKSHPRDPSLLFSASKDLSIRLWRIDTMQTVTIFAGSAAIDVHLSGDFFASSGMDRTVNIWSLCTPVMKNAINSSISRPSSSSRAFMLFVERHAIKGHYRAVVAVLLCFCGR